MAPALGKRKRRTDLETDDTSNQVNDSSADAQDLLRQHFEKNFEPLSDSVARSQLVYNIDSEPSEEELESDWDGFSDNGETTAEIVHHATSTLSKPDISKDEFKVFMSTKPPASAHNSGSTTKPKQLHSTDNDEASTDAANLKKDLALQRLLKESHLLDPDSSLSHSGKNRHKALDLRLQDMGSKTSLFAQPKNMPLAQRKGIAAKAAKKEEVRRKEARENGIVLEKVVKRKKKKHEGVRMRGIGGPSVGRFERGMLKLSSKDVAKIEGPKRTARRKR